MGRTVIRLGSAVIAVSSRNSEDSLNGIMAKYYVTDISQKCGMEYLLLLLMSDWKCYSTEVKVKCKNIYFNIGC